MSVEFSPLWSSYVRAQAREFTDYRWPPSIPCALTWEADGGATLHIGVSWHQALGDLEDYDINRWRAAMLASRGLTPESLRVLCAAGHEAVAAAERAVGLVPDAQPSEREYLAARARR